MQHNSSVKTLVVYYSRTGTTKKVGQEIARQLKADEEEIFDVKSRLGPIGWLRSGREAMNKKLTEIKPIKKNPSKYDMVVIGTPIWAANMSSPVRTYLSKHKFKKTAYFLTGGGVPGKTFEEMSAIAGKPVATLAITSKEAVQNTYSGKVEEFIASLK
jgi:flavodoxin